MTTKNNPTLTVQKRTLSGRKVKQLRRDGILPANVYGKKTKSLSVQLNTKEFSKLYTQIGGTNLIELAVDGEKEKRPVLVHKVQVHPLSDLPIHADFYQVDLAEKVTTEVPVELQGEAPAIALGGVLVQLIDKLEVEALPADLPDKLVVDVSGLAEVGNHLTAEDLQYDKSKVTLKLDDPLTMIVQIEEPTKEEEVVTAPAAEGEAAPEGEAPAAEGEAKPVEAPSKEEKGE